MQEVTYAGGTFITSDEVAQALVEYAAALANADRAARVEVPAAGLATGGTALTVLVGPASQLMAEPVLSDDEEPDGSEFVREIRAEIDRLGRRWAPESSGTPLDWDV